MIRGILAAVCLGISGAAFADETLTVYQLDGSVNCRTSDSISPERAADSLRQAGVKVISSESRTVPFHVPGSCGTPTGRANVLRVDAADWKAMLRKRAHGSGYGVWVFDRPDIEVYKYDGSLQCARGNAMDLEEMARQLTGNGITVKSSRKGNDARVRIAMCGASTGALNVYTIPTADLGRARELGFEVLVTRPMSLEVTSAAATRRGPALSRTPPERPGGADRDAIPQLW